MSTGSKKLDEMTLRVRNDAQAHWDTGYTHYMLSIDGMANTAYMIQWVESIGWRLEHAGWVWAEKGYMGYGGFGVLNSGLMGNFLFGRPGGPSSLARRPSESADEAPTRRDM